jgi:hypothetical protein
MLDLFGDDRRPPAASLRPIPAPVALDLFSAAAERAALASGRPKSQERVEIVAPAAPTYFVLTRRLRADRPPWRCVLVTADFAEAHAVSDRLGRHLPRIAPRETSIVEASALTQSERDRYTAHPLEFQSGCSRCAEARGVSISPISLCADCRS